MNTPLSNDAQTLVRTIEQIGQDLGGKIGTVGATVTAHGAMLQAGQQHIADTLRNASTVLAAIATGPTGTGTAASAARPAAGRGFDKRLAATIAIAILLLLVLAFWGRFPSPLADKIAVTNKDSQTKVAENGPIMPTAVMFMTNSPIEVNGSSNVVNIGSLHIGPTVNNYNYTGYGPSRHREGVEYVSVDDAPARPVPVAQSPPVYVVPPPVIVVPQVIIQQPDYRLAWEYPSVVGIAPVQQVIQQRTSYKTVNVYQQPQRPQFCQPGNSGHHRH